MNAAVPASRVRLRAWRLRLPLTTPYALAFGAVEAFDTVLVEVDLDGRIGYGEASVLTGYTEETIEGAWELASGMAAGLDWAPASAVLDAADALVARAPFTATAFRTAVEMAQGHPVLDPPGELSVPLLAILNASAPDALAAEIDRRLAEGYRTLKIKVGFDREADQRRVRFIQELVRGRGVLLTIDANQGYAREDGVRFAAELDPADVLFFEQACAKDDWDAAVAVARAATTPVMLDESIYDLADVERAAALGCAGYVKLKLMKCGGLDRLAAAIARAGELGLEVVLGNGVATDVGCWMEACVGSGRIRTAGEMNGFLKPARGILAHGLRVDDGCLVAPAGWRPVPDRAAVEAQTVARSGRS
jgi:L-alanine-DL-glutamate epimerase-like enolase superfamily enzyme